MLGGSVNDFYFELAVRVVEVCRATRAENGGMMEVEEVRKRVQKGRGIGGGMEVSEYVTPRAALPCQVIYLSRPNAFRSTVTMFSAPLSLSNPWVLASPSCLLVRRR